MSYDAALAARVRAALAGHAAIVERRMFGGLAFLLRGNMLCGVQGGRLVLRLGRDGADAALARAHVRPMDFTGKPLRSMVYVDPPGLRRTSDLKAWLRRALEFSATLPAGGRSRARRTRGLSGAVGDPRRGGR